MGIETSKNLGKRVTELALRLNRWNRSKSNLI
jgi:hypothetical protein